MNVCENNSIDLTSIWINLEDGMIVSEIVGGSMISGLPCQISFWPWFHNTTVTTSTTSLQLDLEDDSRTNGVRYILLMVLVVVVSPIAQIGYGYRELEAKFALQRIDHAPSSNCLIVETQPRFWHAQRAAYAVYPPKARQVVLRCARRI